MARLADVPLKAMTADQRRIRDAVAEVRAGHFMGPFPIWLRLPPVATAANALGNALRVHGTLGRVAFGMIVLIVARRWHSAFEWTAHEVQARAAGMDGATIAALYQGIMPAGLSERDAAMYRVVTELTETGRLADQSYAEGVAVLGIDTMIEVVTVVGFYTMVALTLNAFDVAPLGGVDPFSDTSQATGGSGLETMV